MRPLHEQLAGRLLHKLADGLQAHPLWFVFPQLALLVICLVFTATQLRFSTNRSDLVSADEKYQQVHLLLKQEFKFQDSLVAIVESENQDKNRQFVECLAQRLRTEPHLFQSVYYKGDLKMMGPKALLFLPEETLDDLRRTLIEDAPIIQTFSQVDSLDSLFALVNRQLREAGTATSTQRPALSGMLPVLRRIVEESSKSVSGTAVGAGARRRRVLWRGQQPLSHIRQQPDLCGPRERRETEPTKSRPCGACVNWCARRNPTCRA